MERDGEQETIAVDKWIVFQAPKKIAKLVKVCDVSVRDSIGHSCGSLSVMNTVSCEYCNRRGSNLISVYIKAL